MIPKNIEEQKALVEKAKGIFSQYYLGVSSVRAECNLYRHELDTLFVEHAGQTAQDYLDQVRFSEAKRLMVAEPALKISEISERLLTYSSDLHRIFKARTGKSPGAYQCELRLEEAKRLIAADLTLKIDDVVEHLGVPRDNLFRWFKVHVGQTPGAYQGALRLAEAKRLLLWEPDMSVLDIAACLGLQEVGFSSFFKKKTGQTPRAYRKSVFQDFDGFLNRVFDGIYEGEERGAISYGVGIEPVPFGGVPFLLSVFDRAVAKPKKLSSKVLTNIKRIRDLLRTTRLTGDEVYERVSWGNGRGSMAQLFFEATGERMTVYRQRVWAQYGEPPRSELPERIVKAQELLATTKRPIADVARRCGYENCISFSGAFRRVVGMGLTRYRAEAFKARGEDLRPNRFLKAQRLVQETSLSLDEIRNRCGWKNSPDLHRTFSRYAAEMPLEYRLRARMDEVLDALAGAEDDIRLDVEAFGFYWPMFAKTFQDVTGMSPPEARQKLLAGEEIILPSLALAPESKPGAEGGSAPGL